MNVTERKGKNAKAGRMRGEGKTDATNIKLFVLKGVAL